jgi:malate synthase
VKSGTGPYLYLPKLESHREARYWNEVLAYAERTLDLVRGAIKATVLIETLPAAFEMDEILYELRDRSTGLNCGRWDYIFSAIKTRQADPAFILPDRAQMTMDRGFLHAYAQRLVATCHRRGAHAIGGMAAQIPVKDDPVANAAALAKVRADKQREVSAGHDGTWVAHPALVDVARQVFDRSMPGPHQIDRAAAGPMPAAAALLERPAGARTEAGLRTNLRVGLRYVSAWLGGTGCVPIDHLMEDAATAEICRTQVWQWLRHGASLDDGRIVSHGLVERILDEEVDRLGAVPQATAARRLFERLATAGELEEFLTVPAYDLLVTLHD